MLNQCGSPLPRLEQQLVDFERETRKTYNQPTPFYIMTNWSHYSVCQSFSDILISSEMSETFSTNVQTTCKFIGLHKLVFFEHNMFIISLNLLSICVSSLVLPSWDICIWHCVEHCQLWNHFEHLTGYHSSSCPFSSHCPLKAFTLFPLTMRRRKSSQFSETHLSCTPKMRLLICYENTLFFL